MKLRTLLLTGSVLATMATPALASPIVNYAETDGSSSAAAVVDSGSFTVTAGDTLAVILGACTDANACEGSGVAVPTVSSVLKKSGTGTLGTCAIETGTASSGTHPIVEAIELCPITASGSMVVEATWSQAVYYGSMGLVDLQGAWVADGSVGHNAYGTDPNVSVSTNGNTSLANDVVIAGVFGYAPFTAGSGYTLFSGSHVNEYSLTNSAGAQTATASNGDNTNSFPWNAAIDALKPVPGPSIDMSDSSHIAPGANGSFLGVVNGAWTAGQTGPVGPAGAAGTNGNTVRNGTGAPAASTGANGDFYIDTQADSIYGPKASGAWPSSGVSLVGAQGPAGQNAGQNTYPACPAHTDTATVGESEFCQGPTGNTDIAVAPAANTWVYFGPAAQSAP